MQSVSMSAGMSLTPPSMRKIAEPMLYLSSEDAGWDDLSVEAFYEPRELEGWLQLPTSTISLVLFTGGPLHVEYRQKAGSWSGTTLHHGELTLSAGRTQPEEVRWKSLSSIPTHTLHLHLRRELVLRAAAGAGGKAPDHQELASRGRFQDPLLTQIAFALRQELEQPTPAGKAFARSAAQLLAVHLARAYTQNATMESDTPALSGGLSARQIRQLSEFVQRHLSEPLSTETLARLVGFSPYHFARLFRCATGASPHQYVLRRRLERAQWLLEQTEVPLAQVAAASGFADQSHLTLVFRQQLGCTPRVYRRTGGTGM